MTGQVTLKKERLKTVSYYADLFMDSKRQTTVPRTHERYLSIIKHSILPVFGDSPIRELKVSNVEKWRNDLLKRFTAKTVKEYQIVLRGIFQKALHDEEIGKNPIDALDSLKVKKPHVVPFMPYEVKLILDTAQGWFKNYLALGFMTGMRVGEIVALKWENVNLKKREIYVCASRIEGVEGTTKTQSSIRYIPIIDTLVPFLEAQKKLSGDKEYVFVNQYGEVFYDYKTIGANQWKSILKECKLDHRRMYEMRHTCATNLLMSGQYSVNEIASILGHTTPQMLFERYTRNISAERKPFNKTIDIYGVAGMAL
ncbi:tyrosine-type recombinase/integrase [Sulfuricurvum kujiense]|uniref:tyrosine-type recombinase/integrase n=1 Tax=Sulfuricurvum kujiense TaxID=148813 RepID=UPI0005A093F2|nr:site-specific integrase [Sulfuricurvum kujiense]